MTNGLRLLMDVRQERDTVFLILDDGETLELALSSVPKKMPEIGESISSPLLAELRLAAQRKKVARRIFSLLDRRLMPVAKIKTKLLDEEFPETAIEAVLDQMSRQGIYSDHVYAAAYCRDTLATRLVGKRYLVNKLWGKQIPINIAKEAVDQNLDDETEIDLAYKAAAWKWKRIRGPIDRKAEEKVARYLVGRGFPTGLAWQAVKKNQPHWEEEY